MNNSAKVFPMEIHPSPTLKTKSSLKRKSILEEIKELNQLGSGKIKLRVKKLKTGKYSLFLDITKQGKREKQYLELYVYNKRETKTRDKETVALADKIKTNLQNELNLNPYKILNIKKSKANFVEYFKAIVDSRTTSIKPWKNTYNYLNRFTKGLISFEDITENWCESFKNYLLKNVSQNSTHTYFARLKAALRLALKDEIISKNPAQFIQIQKEEVEREFLILDEIIKLKNTPCIKEDTKQAFLFTCFTGLRISDIKRINFNQIEGNYLRFRQKKTKGVERIKLHSNALEIIQKQKNKYKADGQVFRLSADTNTLNHIKKWVKAAKINKNVSWHTGRHTFATMNLTYGNDLYTVSKLLGHKDIKVTQIYAKLIDKKRDEAIDNLPII